MKPAVVMGYVLVPLFGVFMCIGPLVTRPTVQFGVRVPPEYSVAPVIRRERRTYQWRSAVIAICAVVALIAWGSRRSWVPGRVILAVELAADLGLHRDHRHRLNRTNLADLNGDVAGLRLRHSDRRGRHAALCFVGLAVLLRAAYQANQQTHRQQGRNGGPCEKQH